MKRSLFGYSVSEVNIILDSLKKENESLNATVFALKKQNDNVTVSKKEEVGRLETEIKAHLSTLTEKIERIADLETDLAVSNEAIKGFSDKQAELEAELAANNERISALQSDLAEREADKAALENQIQVMTDSAKINQARLQKAVMQYKKAHQDVVAELSDVAYNMVENGFKPKIESA